MIMASPSDFTVGWICALHIEYTAALAMLDETYPPLASTSIRDDNRYTTGRIGQHHVAITVLPAGEYGTNAAAIAATNLARSFPNARIGLLVGIGGGAPRPGHDVRLGDIVVSVGKSGHGGVYQYDLGKTMQNRAFRPTGHLDKPPRVLLTALQEVKTRHEMQGHQLKRCIEEAFKRNPRLRAKYQRPSSPDRLFLSDVVHPPNNKQPCEISCISRGLFSSWRQSTLVNRPERRTDLDDPVIHYGNIASANQVMKDATVRDKIANEHDMLCFEMEAAGLMNFFPCLVIRGICDYADSHKNDEWQEHAAIVAASYAKDLLLTVTPSGVQAEVRLADLMPQGQSRVDGIAQCLLNLVG
jgi:nucleoside phosphorylase